MHSFRFGLTVFVIGLWHAGAIAEEGKAAGEDGAAKSRICSDDEKELDFLRKHPAVRKMLQELPATHKVKPKVRYIWSDDEEKPLPRLLSLTPLGPKGKPDGAEQHYGSEHRTVPYRSGLKHGTETAHKIVGRRRERRLVSETPWVKGKIHGVKKVYHLPNGKLHMEVLYEKGRRQGEAKTYDLPGRLVKVTPYKNDKTHGEVTEYYPGTEQKKKVIPFRKGKVHGTVFEYYEDGSLKRELPGRDDCFHGIEKAYDEKGQITRTRYWLDDDVVTKEEYLKATKRQ